MNLTQDNSLSDWPVMRVVVVYCADESEVDRVTGFTGSEYHYTLGKGRRVLYILIEPAARELCRKLANAGLPAIVQNYLPDEWLPDDIAEAQGRVQEIDPDAFLGQAN